MRHPLLLGLLLLLALLPTDALRADEVELSGGTLLEGVVLEQDEDHLRLLLAAGVEIDFEAADVAAVRKTEDAPASGAYLRFVEGQTEDMLDTAIVYFVRDDPPLRVDLVGVTHLADAAYYREIQALLDRVDVVLYEAVKPKDETIEERRATQGDEGLMRLQVRMAEFLGLTFQMDGIRYDRPHFVHADLTMEEFQSLSNGGTADAGDAEAPAPTGPGQLDVEQVSRMAKVLGPLIDMLAKLGERMPALQRSIKRSLGRVLAEMGTQLDTLMPAETVTLLIDRRNEVVMARLGEVDPGVRSVAVLYGAGHLEDLEERLVKAGFRRAGARWLTAWRIGE